MCFLNKLLLLAVLGWLFQVGNGLGRVVGGCCGRDRRALESEQGRGQKRKVLRGMGIAMASEDNLLDPGPQQIRKYGKS